MSIATPAEELKAKWIEEQKELRAKLILEDTFDWYLPPRAQPVVAKKTKAKKNKGGKNDDNNINDNNGSNTDDSNHVKNDVSDNTNANNVVINSDAKVDPEVKQVQVQDQGPVGKIPLKFVGGMDISFVEGSDILAITALVVLEFPSMKVVYESFDIVELKYPYIPGFLGFREVPYLVQQIDKLRAFNPDIMPQVILVDGNGVLHQRGFGQACHLGVQVDIPTIGVAKKLLMVDGLQRDEINSRCKQALKCGGDTLELKGQSGRVWGVALRATDDSSKQVYVSPGHRICLKTAVELVYRCCLYRIPEPIRCADLGSRAAVRDWLTRNPVPQKIDNQKQQRKDEEEDEEDS